MKSPRFTRQVVQFEAFGNALVLAVDERLSVEATLYVEHGTPVIEIRKPETARERAKREARERVDAALRPGKEGG